MDEVMTLFAAVGVDVNGVKHPLGLVEGATENASTAQALIDNLVERGIEPALPRLFIIDGSKALSKAIRAVFGRDVAIQRCQIHKARNIRDRFERDDGTFSRSDFRWDRWRGVYICPRRHHASLSRLQVRL